MTTHTTASRAILESVAKALRQAEATAVPIAPITRTHPELTVADAYAIQSINADGREVVGHKIGLTSEAMQQMLGVDEPDYSSLFSGQVLDEPATVATDELIAPRVEPEIAFVLAQPLRGPGVTAEQVLAATDHVIPALEVIDSRIADWKIGLIDTIADNASCARVVLGSTETPADGLDLAAAQVTFSVNGETKQTGAGAAVLGHPAEAVAWLANALAVYDVTLQAGQVIMPGSLTAAEAISAGDHVRADFGPLGSVEVTAR